LQGPEGGSDGSEGGMESDVADSVTARSRPGWRPLVLVALVAVFVAAQAGGLTGGLADPAHVRDLLAASGGWGPAVFVGGFALTHAVGFPSLVLVLLAGAIWPLWPAVAISWVGAMLGTSLAYGLAAWAGHDWAMRRVPARLRHLDRRLAGRGLLAVLGVRLLLLTPAPADWLCGVASIRYRDFLAATSVGLVPPTVVLTAASSGDVHVATLAAAVGGGAALFGVAALLQARGRKRRRHRPSTQTGSDAD
jgi:uncharacterized membrane protein YdjX (TVP38/TMEM64 family)